jgi:hypothetical protein
MTYLRLCLVLAVSGCGLISSDVTDFDLTLPEKSFSVDASGWQVNQTAADAFLNMSCSQTPQNVCTSAAMSACPMNCSARCGSAAKCELGFDVGVYQMIDLVMEKPELKSINDEPIIKVAIDSVSYRVSANTLNVATPQMNVYVAPMSVMDPDDPMAKQIGTIPAIPAGTTVASADLAFTPDGRQNLIDTMSTYKNPFNVIVGAKLWMMAGDPVPTGKLDAVVLIKAHAGL